MDKESKGSQREGQRLWSGWSVVDPETEGAKVAQERHDVESATGTLPPFGRKQAVPL